MACLQNTRKNSIVWPRDIADDPASLAFEAIETIIWKLPIAPVVRIVSKYFETTGAIGTIRKIIWKPGLRLWLKLMPNIKERKLATKLFDALHCYAVMAKYTPLERSSLSSLNCQPVVFFSIYSSSKFIWPWAVVPLLHNAHFPPVSLHAPKEGRVHALVCPFSIIFVPQYHNQLFFCVVSFIPGVSQMVIVISQGNSSNCRVEEKAWPIDRLCERF